MQPDDGMMARMKASDARLQSLVQKMKAAKGDDKMRAMEERLSRELAQYANVLLEHMRAMIAPLDEKLSHYVRECAAHRADARAATDLLDHDAYALPPEIAVHGVHGMDERRRRSGAREGGGDLLRDEPRFPDAKRKSRHPHRADRQWVHAQ